MIGGDLHNMTRKLQVWVLSFTGKYNTPDRDIRGNPPPLSYVITNNHLLYCAKGNKS